MGLFLLLWIGHLALAQLVWASWFVPDLTTVGMVINIGRAPKRWWVWSALAGMLTILWVARMPILIYAVYFGLGALLRFSTGQWNANDARVQSLQVLLAVFSLGLLFCWIDGLWSWTMLAFALARAIVTAFALLLLRRWMSRRVRLPA